MAGEWREIPLGGACSKIGSGATPRGGKDAYLGGVTALIRSQNIYNDRFVREGLVYIDDTQARELRNVVIEEGDVLLNITGDSVARCCQVAPDVLPARVNQHVSIIRPNLDVLDARFLRYSLVSPAMQTHLLALASAGATRNALTKGMIESLSVSAPPLEEQRTIAHILGTLDDKIELNRRMNQTLEAMARALFKSWFVDFDGIPAEDMQESELGLIPKGWRVVALGDVAEQGKGSINPASTPERMFTHYSLPAFDVAQLPLLESGDAIKSNKTPVPDDSVLVSKLNPHIPRIWLVGDAGDNAVCSTEFIVWTPKPPANSAFVYCLASSPMFNDAMRQLVTGTSNSHQRVRPEQLTNLRIIAANDEMIAKFSEATAPLMRKLLHHRQQSQALGQLRDTLLPRLISGELRVANRPISAENRQSTRSHT